MRIPAEVFGLLGSCSELFSRFTQVLLGYILLLTSTLPIPHHISKNCEIDFECMKKIQTRGRGPIGVLDSGSLDDGDGGGGGDDVNVCWTGMVNE